MAVGTAPVVPRGSSAAGEPVFYFPVLVPALMALPDLQCDLYLQAPDTARKVLYRGADCKVPLADDERLAGSA